MASTRHHRILKPALCIGVLCATASSPAQDTVSLARSGDILPVVGTVFRDESLVEVRFDLPIDDATNEPSGSVVQTTIEERLYRIISPTELELELVQNHQTRVVKLAGEPDATSVTRSPLEGETLRVQLVLHEPGQPPVWLHHLAGEVLPTAAQAMALRALPSPFAQDDLFPSEPVAMDESWTVTTDVTGGEAAAPMECLLESVTRTEHGPTAQIRVTTDLAMALEEPALGIEGTLTGTVYRPLDQGLESEWQLQGALQLTEPNAGPSATAGTMTISNRRIVENGR